MSSIARKSALALLGSASVKRSACKKSLELFPAGTVTHRCASSSENGPTTISHLHYRSVGIQTRMAHSAAQTSWITSKDESREMMAVWPDVMRDLTETGRHSDIPNVNKWLAKVLQYNVPGGKKGRALALVFAYKMLAPREMLTDENIRLARILGWCTELHQAFLLVLDDIQDQSETRRGQLCWYLNNNIGLAAITDGVLLEQTLYELLRIHFKNKNCYVELLETFHEITLKTVMGQCLDMMSTNFGKKPNLDLFTMDRYNAIVKYKTAYYTFVMPILLAMHFAGVRDLEMHRQAKTILLEMGHFFQVQDDFLDCYGDPKVTGKCGTDIQEGKCTWLAVVALQRATRDQRKILEECYGSHEPDHVARVKQLYNDLGLVNTYTIYEEETYNLLNTHIQQISRGLPHDLFLKLLEKLYHRVA